VKYAFTRTVARVEIALGLIIMFVAAVLALVAFFVGPQYPLWERPGPRGGQAVLAAAVILAAGLLIGASLVVLGQLVLAFFDMRARVERIDRRLRDRDAPTTERESGLVERMRPRSS
jgi:hypothetical protein